MVDVDRVIQLESSGNPQETNKASGARGLGQITPIALKDYNQLNPQHYAWAQMYDPQINQKVTYWTLTQRIPSMLQHYGIQSTPHNVLWAYHDGVSNVAKGKMSKEAQEELRRYFEPRTGK